MVPSVAAAAFAAALSRAGHDRCVLVAHSISGLVVRSFGALFPGRVFGAVLIDPTVPWFIDGTPEDRDAFRLGGWDPERSRAEAEGVTRWSIDVPLVVLSHDPGQAVAAGVESPHAQRRWSAGQVEYARLVARGAQRDVPGAGHHVHRDCPEAVATAVLDVLNEVARRSAAHEREVAPAGKQRGALKGSEP